MEDEGEFELREEELVDFEGSDYSLGLDDEFDEVGCPLTSINEENIMLEQVELSERRISCLFFGGQTAVCSSSETQQVEAGNGVPKLPNLRRSCSLEGAESEEIKEEKEDGANAQTAPRYDKIVFEDKGVQGRDRKHLRADLEDGELDDAAMPEASNYDGEGNIDVYRISDECIGHERKRKNFKDLAACQTDLKGKEFMEGQSTASVMMQNSSRGRGSDHFGNFPKCKPGARGLRMHRFGHPPANLTPGIMYPTRPLMPRGRGDINQFGVPLGMCTPIQFQEALVQEQILTSNHAFHLGVTGRGHPSFNMNIPPAFGMDYFGPRPRGMMYVQPHGPNMVYPMNCFGVQRPIPRGRNLGRGSCTSLGGRGRFLSRNRSGRPDWWPLHPVDMPTNGRGRLRGHQVPRLIGHEQIRNNRGSQFTTDQKMDLGQEVPIIVVSNADKIKEDGSQRWNPVKREDIENSDRLENNVPSATSNSSVKSQSVSNNRQASVEDTVKSPVSSLAQSSTINSQEVGSGATNMIKLGGPVQRSRVLSVRGLPEGTPLSIVIEAFEKQGKIMAPGLLWDSLHVMQVPRGLLQVRVRQQIKCARLLSCTCAHDLFGQIRMSGGACKSICHGHITILQKIPTAANRSFDYEGIEDGSPSNWQTIKYQSIFDSLVTIFLYNITDVNKEERGDVFTITFSTILEAISAKRLLHRSILGGRQITVDYSL